jgi:putative DNA primase/helicase
MSLTLNELAHRLNGSPNGAWLNIRGPHHSAADRSLGIRFDLAAPDGFYVHSLAGDDKEECRAYVKSLLQKLDGDLCAICGPEPEHDPSSDIAARVKRAMALWQEGTSPAGTLVEAYLNSRRCALESILGSEVIRFHPACPFGTLRVPAMLALITDAVTGEPIGVHRTAIKDDGSGKRFGAESKKMLGVARRGAVRLHAASEHLGIAEGIETALSAEQMFGTPVWATLSKDGIEAFPVIPGVKRLTIFADHDDAGITAAHKCGLRYKMSGIDGEIHVPPIVKSDWNDWMMEQA